jgi:tetratricopeptide (TPR) repeat protein
MNRFVTLTLLLALTTAGQTTDQPPARFHVAVEEKSSPTEQMRFAAALGQKVAGARSRAEEQMALMTAISHLEVIGLRWPREKAFVFQAGLLEADLFAQYHAPRNAMEVLDRLGPQAEGVPQRLEVERRRAALLAKMGRVAEADAAFHAALSIPASAPHNRLPLLNDAATFYLFQERYHDRSLLLREMAALQGSPMLAMQSILGSLEANLRIPDLAEARKDYSDLAALYESVQQRPPVIGSGDDAAMQIVRNALDRYRERLGK